MILNETIDMQRIDMNNCDDLKLNYLTDRDLAVCNYVVSKLPYIDFKSIMPGNKISLEQLMEFSVNEMSFFGNDIYLKLSNLITETIIRSNTNAIDDFTTFVGYDVLFDGNVIIGSGKVSEYVIPSKLYELSIYLLCHEHIHSLKDTNYDEYQNSMVLGEVIPIFYEFLIYDSKDVLKRELIRLRMNNLMYVKREYLDYDFYAKRSSKYDLMFERKSGIVSDETRIYEFIRSKLGCYLNSFYYAMILYNLYKENSKMILDLVKKILMGEMTTLEMLQKLHIYGNIQEMIFEKEIRGIKKIVRK